jgi:hypothetical protein
MSAEPSIVLSIIEAFIHPREGPTRRSPGGRPVYTDGLVSLRCLNSTRTLYRSVRLNRGERDLRFGQEAPFGYQSAICRLRRAYS